MNPDEKSMMAEVGKAVEALRQAMIAGDRLALDALTAEQLTYGHGLGHVETKAQFIDKLASGRAGWSAIELSDQIITLADNVAIVRHVFRGVSRNPPDGIVNKTLSVLSVWLLQQGTWKLLARQAVGVK
jgi:hypothetical protein